MTKDFEKRKQEKIQKEFLDVTRDKTVDLAIEFLKGTNKICMELSTNGNSLQNEHIMTNYLMLIMYQFFYKIISTVIINQPFVSEPDNKLFGDIITRICEMIKLAFTESMMKASYECIDDKETLLEDMKKMYLAMNGKENVTKH